MDTRNNQFEIPSALIELGKIFEQDGHEMWLVGGCVRDSLMGLTPKDIDLTTSATPDEQIAIYQREGLHYIETGLQHGTVTVVLDTPEGREPFEITTYRIDRETDGRHATVEFTRSLEADLQRRDLTMNAVAMSFDRVIFDPFGGVADIENRCVRFVGDANERVREDYLRILRFFRFLGRFTTRDDSADVPALEAIRDNAEGLKNISVERVWSEVSKIVSGPESFTVLSMMGVLGVSKAIGMRVGDTLAVEKAQAVTSDPAVLMAILLGEDVTKLGQRWKWSNEEKETARFIKDRAGEPFTSRPAYTLDRAKRDLVNGQRPELVKTMMAILGSEEDQKVIGDWDVPVFPVTGAELIQRGVKPGPEMGAMLKKMREEWIASDYSLERLLFCSWG